MLPLLKFTFVFATIIGSTGLLFLFYLIIQIHHVSNRMEIAERQLEGLTKTQQDQARSVANLNIDLLDVVSTKGPLTVVTAVFQPVAPTALSTTKANDDTNKLREFRTELRRLDGGTQVFSAVLEDAELKRQNPFILEIGAGDGRQATQAAVAGFKVVSIEAFINNIGQGKNRARGAGVLDKIQWINTAISDYTGNGTFVGISGMGRLLKSTSPEIQQKWSKLRNAIKMEVPVHTLDDVDIPGCPILFKVDVEGNELKVFERADNFMSRCRPPMLIIEFNPWMMRWSANSSAIELLDMLLGYGYTLYDSQISEPRTHGFMAKYGRQRPSKFDEVVEWFLKSNEFDNWGSWTDIIAVLPKGSRYGESRDMVWQGFSFSPPTGGKYNI
eukprot:TRINITY_DN28107_c0_g1_i1.p1 TRINITY_DN28107_c0_g1~~TRINITY_DN28107_c0_g1_i1.p1  ORF type:complete len:386 (+),score=26.06 TRINITY_DN28107_c0_g1_i1:21-1178(+)